MTCLKQNRQEQVELKQGKLKQKRFQKRRPRKRNLYGMSNSSRNHLQKTM